MAARMSSLNVPLLQLHSSIKCFHRFHPTISSNETTSNVFVERLNKFISNIMRRTTWPIIKHSYLPMVLIGILLLLCTFDTVQGFKIDLQTQSKNEDETVTSAKVAKFFNNNMLTDNETTSTDSMLKNQEKATTATISYRTSIPLEIALSTIATTSVVTDKGLIKPLDQFEGARVEIFITPNNQTKKLNKSHLYQRQRESIFVNTKPSTLRPYFINFTQLIKPTKSSGIQKKYVILEKRRNKGKSNATSTTTTPTTNKPTTAGVDWSRRKSSNLRLLADPPMTANDRQRSKKKTLVKVKVVNGNDQILVYTSTTTPASPTTVTAKTMSETTNMVTLPYELTTIPFDDDTANVVNKTAKRDSSKESNNMNNDKEFENELNMVEMSTTTSSPLTIMARQLIDKEISTTTEMVTTTKMAIPITTTASSITIPTTDNQVIASNENGKESMITTTTVTPVAFSPTSMNPSTTYNPLEMTSSSYKPPKEYFNDHFSSMSSTSTEPSFSSSSLSYIDYSLEFDEFDGTTSSTTMSSAIELLDKNESEEMGGHNNAMAGEANEETSSIKNETFLNKEAQAQGEERNERKGKLSNLQTVLIGLLIAIGSIIFVLVAALAYISWSKLKITPEVEEEETKSVTPPVKIVMQPDTNVNIQRKMDTNLLHPPDETY